MENSRTVPALASDVRRSWIAVLACLPLAFLVPIAVAFLDIDIPGSARVASVLFVYWAMLSVVSTVMSWAAFRQASGAELKRWLVATKPPARGNHFWYSLNGGGAASWAVTGSAIAVISVLALSFNPEFRASPFVVYSGIAVVVTSLAMTIVAYAVRYAREFATDGGIEFAKTTEPTFSDFLYLAVQVATTFSTSDVTITTTSTRRLVTANALISFSFNTVIVALLVSVLVAAAQP